MAINLILAFFLLLASPAYADFNDGGVFNKGVLVSEQDGSPSVKAKEIKFSNGTVTDNSDGTVSVSSGSGGGGATPSGPANAVQFEASGALAGDSGFTFNATTDTVTVGGAIVSSSLVAPNSSNPSLSTAGQIAVDTSSTSGSMIRFYGDASYAIPAYESRGIVLDTPTTNADYPLPTFPFDITIQEIRLLTRGPAASSLTGILYNCNTVGLLCSAIGTGLTSTVDTVVSDTASLTNKTLTANNMLFWDTTSVTGAVTSDTVTIIYTVNPG